MAAATLRLSHGTALRRSLTTDAHGRFRLAGATPGAWSLEVSAEGFRPRQLMLDTGHGTRLEIRLEAPPPPAVDAALLALVREADAAFARGDWATARGAYEHALQLRPADNSTLHLQIARCLGHEGDYAGELRHLQLRLDVEPDNAGLIGLMAQESARAGLLPRALALLDRLDAEAARNPRVYFDTAAILLNQGQAEAVLPLLDRTLRTDPDFVDALLQRGLLLLRLHRLGEARRDLERLLALQPQHPEAALLRRTLAELPLR